MTKFIRTFALTSAAIGQVFMGGCAQTARTTVVPVLATATAVATQPIASTTPAVAANTPPASIHWFRNSSEMRGIYLEIYHTAGDQLVKMAASVAPQTWAVILDADETTIDNSEYEKERAALHAPYSDSAWREWVFREAAPALPGAVEFIRLAHQLGGRVVIVTNRAPDLCDATRENFRRDSIPADLVLCRITTGDKNPRFQSVQNGTASPNLPALKVLMWFGDNIQDFPGLSQSLRGGPDSRYDDFGKIYFLLPNPMYGSWERVDYR